MTEMKSKFVKYPIGVQSFSELRENGYVYIDKTDIIYNLVHTGKYYFLSRPRRFGKSLLLSTLEAYFSAKKELFEGLAISELEDKWEKYPVVHIDMNTGYYNEPDGVQMRLSYVISVYEKEYGITSTEPISIADRFDRLLKVIRGTTGMNTVILIDEYDKPILSAMGDEELEKAHRNALKPFYGVLKTCDEYIKFAFLTGVTKIGKLSVFSDLNNLSDISMDASYATLCGISLDEAHDYFADEIADFGRFTGKSYEEMFDKLKFEYDGYRFSKAEIYVFNPFSFLNALLKRDISSFWFSTGTPSYLVHLLRRDHFNLWSIDGVERKANQLMDMRIDGHDPIPVIYQSGYLTIKDYNEKFNKYILGFPNREVREGFLDFLLPAYTGERVSETFDIERLVNEISCGDVDAFMRRLQAIFANIPYVEAKDFDYEATFRNVMYIIFSMLGFYTDSEKHIVNGRIDLVVRTASVIYVMEFKAGKTPEYALNQIDENGYTTPFQADGRKIIRIAVTFDPQKRNIDRWVYE